MPSLVIDSKCSDKTGTGLTLDINMLK